VQSSREDLPLQREVRRRASASSDPPALEPTRARLLRPTPALIEMTVGGQQLCHSHSGGVGWGNRGVAKIVLRPRRSPTPASGSTPRLQRWLGAIIFSRCVSQCEALDFSQKLRCRIAVPLYPHWRVAACALFLVEAEVVVVCENDHEASGRFTASIGVQHTCRNAARPL
jgi:hypothetical protein